MSALFQRLVRNSIKPDDQNENGCWIWTGNTNNGNYGRFSVRCESQDEWGEPRSVVRKVYAHRAMEQLMRDQAAQLEADMAADDWLLGEVVAAELLDPDTQTLDHLCCCRRCINPDHWTVVTRAENTALMQQRRKQA